MKTKTWCVLVADCRPSEKSRDMIGIGCIPCGSREDAVNRLNEYIRDEWTTWCNVGNGETPLADLRGYESPDGTIGYTKDGETAWVDYGDHQERGEVVEIEVEVK